MTRRTYQLNNCLTHLTDRVHLYEEEIAIVRAEKNSLSHLVRLREEEAKVLTHGICAQKVEYERVVEKLKEENKILNDEKRGLSYSAHYYEEQVKKIRGQKGQYERAKHLQAEKLVGQMVDKKQQQQNIPSKRMISSQNWRAANMKIESNIFVVGNKNAYGFVTTFDCLTPSNSLFRVKILSVDDIYIGVKSVDTLRYISYASNGSLCFFGISCVEKAPLFQYHDIIECGIRSFQSDNNVQVYFYHNGQLVIERSVKTPPGGYFPSVYMSGTAKIEYLSNEIPASTTPLR